jgi:hypothetical protein
MPGSAISQSALYLFICFKNVRLLVSGLVVIAVVDPPWLIISLYFQSKVQPTNPVTSNDTIVTTFVIGLERFVGKGLVKYVNLAYTQKQVTKNVPFHSDEWIRDVFYFSIGDERT